MGADNLLIKSPRWAGQVPAAHPTDGHVDNRTPGRGQAFDESRPRGGTACTYSASQSQTSHPHPYRCLFVLADCGYLCRAGGLGFGALVEFIDGEVGCCTDSVRKGAGFQGLVNDGVEVGFCLVHFALEGFDRCRGGPDLFQLFVHAASVRCKPLRGPDSPGVIPPWRTPKGS
jgi:hypothetical protein